MKITKNTKVWESLKKKFRQAQQIEGKLGFFSDAVYGPENDNLPVAQVAKWVEEGHVAGGWANAPTPPRPVFRVGLAEAFKLGWNKKDFQAMVTAVATGKTPLIAMQASDDSFKRSLQNVITAWFDPPNSPATIEMKGFDNPWIETGTLRESVDFKVGRKE